MLRTLQTAKIYSCFYQVLLYALLLSGCAIEVNQPSATPPVEIIPTAVSTSAFPATRVPVTWGSLKLSGKLIYISSPTQDSPSSNTIQRLDLATGEIETLFTTPPGGWIYYATLSPDATSLVMSYSPPAQPGVPSSRSLYSLPLDSAGEPNLLFNPPTPDDHYTQAEWSPDGKYIYYVQYNSQIRHEGQLDPVFNIFRMQYPNSQPEKILSDAFWMRPSSDSSKMIYIHVDPTSSKNELYVANADGSNPEPIALSGPQVPEIIDAPIFSPDGQFILFSAPEPSQAYQPNFFERLMGIQVARAHSVPSDWWSVPLTGGVPNQLTHLQTINLYASLSPDLKYIASLSGDGIFVMDLNGSNLTQLVSDAGVHGTVRWIR